MKVLAYYLIIAWAARIFYAFEITDDMYMFLPFLQNQEPIPSCPPNELYKTCSGNCSDCTQRGACLVTRCIEGCDCAPRFYRVRPDGPCEPVANCPKLECGENEDFRECGPICERCTTFKCHILNCDHKCYCKKGYLRDKEGLCIPEEECPKRLRCGRTEEWSEVGLVDEFCLISENATASNETQEVEACYCKEGHKRNALGYCISEERCPLIQCPGVEVYRDCIPKCNTTCRNYGDPDCIEDDNCYQGCFCPPGYAMNDFRTCVLLGDCTLDIEHVLVWDQPEEEEDESPSFGNTNTTTFDESTGESTNITTFEESTSEITNTTTFDENTGENIGTTTFDESAGKIDSTETSYNETVEALETDAIDEEPVDSSMESNDDEATTLDSPTTYSDTSFDGRDENLGSDIVSTTESYEEQSAETTEESPEQSNNPEQSNDEFDFDNEET